MSIMFTNTGRYLPPDIILYIYKNTMARYRTPAPMSEEEKSFGIVQKKKTHGILLRNWITYLMRHCIAQHEREAYTSKKPSVEKIKVNLNKKMVFEITMKLMRHRNEGNLAHFEKIIAHANVLCRPTTDEAYEVRKFFKQGTIFTP